MSTGKLRLDGFAGQHLVVVPQPVREAAAKHSLLRNLLVTDAGYFPAAKGHLVERERGSPTHLVIACLRGGDQVRVDADQIELAATTPDEKVLLINDALEQLQVQDPEKAKVVVLKFFGGRTNQEVAESLAVTERTVERHWAYAKAWLFQHIRAQN